jgi:hypothetical protein
METRGENDQKSALLFAGHELVEGCLNHFRMIQKPVELVKKQQHGTIAFGQGGQRP